MKGGEGKEGEKGYEREETNKDRAKEEEKKNERHRQRETQRQRQNKNEKSMSCSILSPIYLWMSVICHLRVSFVFSWGFLYNRHSFCCYNCLQSFIPLKDFNRFAHTVVVSLVFKSHASKPTVLNFSTASIHIYTVHTRRVEKLKRKHMYCLMNHLWWFRNTCFSSRLCVIACSLILSLMTNST